MSGVAGRGPTGLDGAIVERLGVGTDALLYAGSAAVALGVGVLSDHRIHQAAAESAVVAYGVGAVASLVLLARAAWRRTRSPLSTCADRSRARAVDRGGSAATTPLPHGSRRLSARLLRWRVVVAGAVFVGAAIAPQLHLVADRSDDPTGYHAHAETAVIEEGARSVLDGRNPYGAEFDGEGISYWSDRIRTHFPYLPAMTALGLPRALTADAPVADGRLVFMSSALAIFAVAAALWRTSGARRLLAFQWLFVVPTGALLAAGGGHDLPVLALMLLGLVLLGRRSFVAAGLALGLAAAMRHNAWVLLPFAVLVAPALRDRARLVAAMVGVVAATTVPFALWDPGSFVEDVVRWPLGLGEQATNAQAPTLGSVIVDLVPAGRVAVVALLLGAVLATAAVVTWRRPPSSPADAARYAGLTLLGLIVFAPAGRIGYLVYPVSLLAWSFAFGFPAKGSLDRTAGPAGDRSGTRSAAVIDLRPLEVPGGQR